MSTRSFSLLSRFTLVMLAINISLRIFLIVCFSRSRASHPSQRSISTAEYITAYSSSAFEWISIGSSCCLPRGQGQLELLLLLVDQHRDEGTRFPARLVRPIRSISYCNPKCPYR
uniref:(northern house mosquito) hypothetical protein n=1 Tax=Culex pipiens TaxID=7175 RepID=A0A8D8B224_CULPI